MVYGETLRKPNQVDVINYQENKVMSIEIIWDDYRLVRTMEVKKEKVKHTLHLWSSPEHIWNEDTLESKGGVPTTQKLINGLLGINYDTFVNIFIFSDTSHFLECQADKRRDIVESLLSLDKYRVCHDIAKKRIKDVKEEIALLANDYQYSLNEINNCKERLKLLESKEKMWKEQKIKELNNLLQQIKAKREELDKTDDGSELAKYEDAQEQIEQIKLKLNELEASKKKSNELLPLATEKYNSSSSECSKLTLKINKLAQNETICCDTLKENEAKIKNIEKNCPYCEAPISQSKISNIIGVATQKITSAKEELIKIRENLKISNDEFSVYDKSKKLMEKGMADCNGKITRFNKEITDCHTMLSRLTSIRKPEANKDTYLLQEQMKDLKNQALIKQTESEGASPFTEIKTQAEEELKNRTEDSDNKKKKLEEIEAKLPYFDFWIKAFGDGGIRKYIIDGIIPTLNEKLAYWMQILIDGKIKIEFDNQFKATIDRFPFNDRPYVYEGMSGGQRRRLNLSICQAFANIMMLNWGTYPSVIFLDEVSMNMDEDGVEGIYQMICELAKDKQVFVIDHNKDLLNLLQGNDTINLEMKNEITTKT